VTVNCNPHVRQRERFNIDRLRPCCQQQVARKTFIFPQGRLRLLSFIPSKRLLDGPIALCGTQGQFGSQTGAGCRDAIFTIRLMLQLFPCHNLLPTWTLRVDPAKAFDTVNHQLHFKLLMKFGVPEHMTGAIERLCKDAEEKKTARENRTIPCSSAGVKQGDNMAPVLFLFLMQALSETLEKEWNENKIAIPEFKQRGAKHSSFSPSARRRWSLQLHEPK
jgi:hypothetical protein